MKRFRFRSRSLTAAVLLSLGGPATAVQVSADGLGQALIYPYYTVRTGEGGAFNTYVSITNATRDAKALRVRFRESRNGREVASFNLYLAPNDVWAGALVPSNAGTRLVSVDTSCVEPVPPAGGLEFSNAAFTDGAGEGLDRTREGYIEVLEMATLTRLTSVRVTPASTGVPADCPHVNPVAAGDIGPPTGGISGTLTLINVADGSDYSVNAEALSELSTRPFFRQAAEPYPAFDAAEIDVVSVITTDDATYRSVWSRGLDAVSAALMRVRGESEYVLDFATASLTEVVLTLPTKPFHMTGTSASAPFTAAGGWKADPVACERGGEKLDIRYFNRGQRGAQVGWCCFGGQLPPDAPAMCSAATTFTVSNGRAHIRSLSGGITQLGMLALAPVHPAFENGWVNFGPSPLASGLYTSMTSLPNSTRLDATTGAVTTGAHTLYGWPMAGFSMRSLRNGNLSCGTATCQGNYGSAFPMKYRRSISARP